MFANILPVLFHNRSAIAAIAQIKNFITAYVKILQVRMQFNNLSNKFRQQIDCFRF